MSAHRLIALMLAGLAGWPLAAHAVDFQLGWCPALPGLSRHLQQDIANDVARHRDDLPHPQPRLHTEGTLPHQGIYDQSIEAKKDLPRMRTLALSWRLTHNPADLDQLEKLMRAWANMYQLSFNPIDETDFEAFVDAYALANADFGMDTQSALGNFVRNMATGYFDQMRHVANGKGTWINNWQSHRIKLATLAAVAVDDPSLLAEARNQFRHQLSVNLNPDGSTIDFAERDALHYTVYDLEPLLRAALAARMRGEDWFNLSGSNGASLAKALNWLLPYARGDVAHAEFVHTRVQFDLDRKQAGLNGYSGSWDPKNARNLYWMATLFDPRYASLAASLGAVSPWQAACWMGQ